MQSGATARGLFDNAYSPYDEQHTAKPVCQSAILRPNVLFNRRFYVRVCMLEVEVDDVQFAPYQPFGGRLLNVVSAMNGKEEIV